MSLSLSVICVWRVGDAGRCKRSGSPTATVWPSYVRWMELGSATVFQHMTTLLDSYEIPVYESRSILCGYPLITKVAPNHETKSAWQVCRSQLDSFQNHGCRLRWPLSLRILKTMSSISCRSKAVFVILNHPTRVSTM
jgi:hypothetical protein